MSIINPNSTLATVAHTFFNHPLKTSSSEPCSVSVASTPPTRSSSSSSRMRPASAGRVGRGGYWTYDGFSGGMRRNHAGGDGSPLRTFPAEPETTFSSPIIPPPTPKCPSVSYFSSTPNTRFEYDEEDDVEGGGYTPLSPLTTPLSECPEPSFDLSLISDTSSCSEASISTNSSPAHRHRPGTPIVGLGLIGVRTHFKGGLVGLRSRSKSQDKPGLSDAFMDEILRTFTAEEEEDALGNSSLDSIGEEEDVVQIRSSSGGEEDENAEGDSFGGSFRKLLSKRSSKITLTRDLSASTVSSSLKTTNRTRARRRTSPASVGPVWRM